MARMQNRPSRGAQPYGPPPKSKTAMVVAIIGWVGAGIVLLAILNSTSSQRRAEARIRIAAAEKQRVIDSRIADAEKAVDGDVIKMRKKLVVLNSDFETISKQRNKLKGTVEMLEKRLPGLRERAGAPVAVAPPARKPPTPRNDVGVGALPPGFDPLGPKLPVGGNGKRPPPPPDPAAIAKAFGGIEIRRPAPDAIPAPIPNVATAAFDAVLYKKLVAERDRLSALVAKYRDSAKSKLTSLLDSDARGPQLHAFYRSASHTPYGAAALFFAAERYYEDGKLTQAAGAYRDCQEQYPGSPYTATIDDRIDQVMDKDLYRRGDAEVQAYTKP